MNTLTTISNTGILNQYQIIEKEDDIDNKTQIQLIWNGRLSTKIIGLNEKPEKFSHDISRYRAVYLNGIMIVKHGKVFPRKKWMGIF